jgi:type III pantothenate kinase
MNLIIDIGNTNTKLAVYKDCSRISMFRINELDYENLNNYLSKICIEKAIISSVKQIPKFVIDLLTVNIPYVHLLTYRSVLPFTIEYETPQSLGSDRIAALAGATLYYHGKNTLIIDAGTAITYDFLENNIFRGGNISPGITTRYKALNKFTGRLPLVSQRSGFSFPGRNTSDAIAAGVITGVLYEINEYIRTFKSKDSIIILTGGDSEFLKDTIDHQVIYLPDIVSDGLNYILEQNAK